MKKQGLLAILAIVVCTCLSAQTNILDTTTWAEGGNSAAGFNRYGPPDANAIVLGETPGGNQGLIWSCVPGSGNKNDGGWQTTRINIDASIPHRYMVWAKKTGSNDGLTRFATNGFDANGVKTIAKLNDQINNNPFMFTGDLPSLDKWYLMVGVVHEIGFTGTSSEGGIYDPLTGAKVATITDYKYLAGTVQTQHRAFLREVADANNATTGQFLYAPRLERMDGTEPSIQDIIDAEYSSIYYLDNDSDTFGNPEISQNAATPPPGYVSNNLDCDDSNSDINPNTVWHQDSDGDGLGNPSETLVQCEQPVGYVLDNTDTDDTTPAAGGSWTKTGVDLSYVLGNVGIGTNAPDAPLTVRGRIHTQEVKVDLAGAVAPDYVFYKDYPLKTIGEVEAYIAKNGHLPNIPSATEMEENGVNLKEMNLKLLEKIEELTLYLLQQNERLNELENRLGILER